MSIYYPDKSWLPAAIDLAQRNIRVFPVEFLIDDPEGNINVLDDNSTTSVEQIREWWKRWPHAYPCIHLTSEQIEAIGFDPGAEPTFCTQLMAERFPWEVQQ